MDHALRSEAGEVHALLYCREPEQQAWLGGLMEVSGLRFRSVRSEEELWADLGQRPVDTLLLMADPANPEAILELVEQVKEESRNYRGLPLVVLFPEGTPQDVAITALQLGAYDYLIAPFNEIQLLTKITVLAMLKHNEYEFRALAVQDRLTGLYDRQYLHLRLGEEVSRAKRHKAPLACMLMDVDCLAAVNESYGHDAGDSLIQSVALHLRNNKRGSDVLARYGGDCFMLLLWNTGEEGAKVVAQRISETLPELQLRNDPDYKPGVSIGIAILDWDSDFTVLPGGDAMAARLLQDAESSLREAQQQGQRGIVMAGDDPLGSDKAA